MVNASGWELRGDKGEDECEERSEIGITFPLFILETDLYIYFSIFIYM
jgi:hypothetical protein